MFRRSVLLGLAALLLALPATAQRFGFQDATQNRSERDHRRQNDRPRDTREDGRGKSARTEEERTPTGRGERIQPLMKSRQRGRRS